MIKIINSEEVRKWQRQKMAAWRVTKKAEGWKEFYRFCSAKKYARLCEAFKSIQKYNL